MQLFSNPQDDVARITKIDPIENLKLSAPSKDNKIHDELIKPIAIQSLAETFSLNINKAIRVVATISKLPNKDAFDAVPYSIPSMRNIGATMSRTIMPRL